MLIVEQNPHTKSWAIRQVIEYNGSTGYKDVAFGLTEELAKDIVKSYNHHKQCIKNITELTDELVKCEKELDTFHGLGNDAGSGCSITVCNAQKFLELMK